MTKPLYVRSGKGRVWHLVGWRERRRVLSNMPAFPYCQPSPRYWPEHTESPGRVCKNCSKDAHLAALDLMRETRYLAMAIAIAEAST